MSQQWGPSSPVQPPTPTRTNDSNLSNEDKLSLLQQRIRDAYVFKNKNLGLQALQASGWERLANGQLQEADNRSLAIIGDRVLDLHLCMAWLPTNSSRSNYSNRRNDIACNKSLARIGWDRRLDECIIRRQNMHHPVGRAAMATTVEAILGAVYLDAEEQQRGSGMAAVSKVASELGLDFDAQRELDW